MTSQHVNYGVFVWDQAHHYTLVHERIIRQVVGIGLRVVLCLVIVEHGRDMGLNASLKPGHYEGGADRF